MKSAIMDCNSFAGLLQIFRNNKCSVNAFENQDGELVTLWYCKNAGGVEYVKKRTLQKNDCIRVNNYYADGTTEEYYERRE